MESDKISEMNKPRWLESFCDVLIQRIGETARSSLTERLKEASACFSASSVLSALGFSGSRFLKHCLTSRSYFVKTAMMGMLTGRVSSL